MLPALLTTGPDQECLKQSLHGAPPEQVSRTAIYQKSEEKATSAKWVAEPLNVSSQRFVRFLFSISSVF